MKQIAYQLSRARVRAYPLTCHRLLTDITNPPPGTAAAGSGAHSASGAERSLNRRERSPTCEREIRGGERVSGFSAASIGVSGSVRGLFGGAIGLPGSPRSGRSEYVVIIRSSQSLSNRWFSCAPRASLTNSSCFSSKLGRNTKRTSKKSSTCVVRCWICVRIQCLRVRLEHTGQVTQKIVRTDESLSPPRLAVGVLLGLDDAAPDAGEVLAEGGLARGQGRRVGGDSTPSAPLSLCLPVVTTREAGGVAAARGRGRPPGGRQPRRHSRVVVVPPL